MKKILWVAFCSTWHWLCTVIFIGVVIAGVCTSLSKDRTVQPKPPPVIVRPMPLAQWPQSTTKSVYEDWSVPKRSLIEQLILEEKDNPKLEKLATEWLSKKIMDSIKLAAEKSQQEEMKQEKGKPVPQKKSSGG